MKPTLIFAIALAACGGNGSSGPDSAPGGSHLISGGGVAGPPIAGTVYVYVVEDRSATPIAGAIVAIDATTATTDATGLATLAAAGSSLEITATAPGHAATTWVGVTGSNVTLPLEPSPRVTPIAHVSGTIAGWASLPSPSFGHYTLAVVLYSFLDDPAAPENSIVQPTSGTTPLNTCLDSGGGSTCAWQLAARVGPQIHTAVIVDGNAHGTTDPSDDTYTLIGYAAGDPMTLTANQTVSGESLAMVGGATTSLAVSFPAAASGLPYAIAIPELALGASGRIVIPLPPVKAGATTAQVIAPTGKFAGSYDVVALATPSATATTPFSSTFVAASGATATLAPWLPAPGVSSPSGRTFPFTAVAGHAFHAARFSTASGTPEWNVLVLDGSASITLPALSPDPLGAGATTFAMTAADVPGFDATHFDVPTATASLARASGAQTTFTH